MSSRPEPVFRLDDARLPILGLVFLALSAAFAPPAGAQAPGPGVASAAGGNVKGLVTTADGRAVAGARIGAVGVPEPRTTSDVDGRFLLSDARVSELPAAPEIEGNLLPQVPRHRASLPLDYPHPEVLNVSLRGRFESSRFDNDQNRPRLGSLFVADVTLDRPRGESWGAFVSVDSLFDRRYRVQGTPVEPQGTPPTVIAGLRFDLRPR